MDALPAVQGGKWMVRISNRHRRAIHEVVRKNSSKCRRKLCRFLLLFKVTHKSDYLNFVWHTRIARPHTWRRWAAIHFSHTRAYLMWTLWDQLHWCQCMRGEEKPTESKTSEDRAPIYWAFKRMESCKMIYYAILQTSRHSLTHTPRPRLWRKKHDTAQLKKKSIRTEDSRRLHICYGIVTAPISKREHQQTIKQSLTIKWSLSFRVWFILKCIVSLWVASRCYLFAKVTAHNSRY